MAEILHKSSLFVRPQEISDFVVIIGDQRLNVHKSVLQSTSEYFSALFNSEMIETKTKEITLKETLFKPFLIVLKLSYDIVITWNEWLDLKVQELCESIVTANRYQFNECERKLSQKLIDIYEYRMRENGSQEVDNTSLWEVLEMAKLHNLNDLFLLCLEFFDQNIDYAFNTFDKQLISADILLDVIRRDTFGAPESIVFALVHKWIQKQRTYSNMKSVEEQLLLESVRLNLMSFEELRRVSKTQVYDPDVIDRYLKHDLGPDLAHNQRICYESNKMRKCDCHSDIQLKSEHIVVICVNCHLPMKSKINHIVFNIRPLEGLVLLDATYWIGIEDSQAENGFRKIVDYTHNSCIGEQDLYFDTPFVTRSLRIVIECSLQTQRMPIAIHPMVEGMDGPTISQLRTGSYQISIARSVPLSQPIPLMAGPDLQQEEPLIIVEPIPQQVAGSSRNSGHERDTTPQPRRRGGGEEWRRRTFRHRSSGHTSRLLSISSLEYEFNKCPAKTLNSCVIPEVNVCQKFGTTCHSPHFGNRFIAVLTESVLNNDTFNRTDGIPEEVFYYFFQSMDDSSPGVWPPLGSREQKFKDYYTNLQKPIRLQNRNHYYIIRLTQPVAANCLHFEMIIENEKNKHSDAGLAAECKVELCRSYRQDMSSAEWSVVANDTYLQESGGYNLEFELQIVSVIKISGFRYNSDKSLKYSLHLKNFSIPADRQSLEWISGHKLRLEATHEDQD